jgi:molybdopterin molybdotransferase
MVMFHLFVWPAIDLMLGRRQTGPQSGRAVLEQEISVRPGRTQFLRGRLVGQGPVLRVEPYPDQRSGVLRSMVKCRVLIVVPADLSRLDKGREVEVLFLD